MDMSNFLNCFTTEILYILIFHLRKGSHEEEKHANSKLSVLSESQNLKYKLSMRMTCIHATDYCWENMNFWLHILHPINDHILEVSHFLP